MINIESCRVYIEFCCVGEVSFHNHAEILLMFEKLHTCTIEVLYSENPKILIPFQFLMASTYYIFFLERKTISICCASTG